MIKKQTFLYLTLSLFVIACKNEKQNQLTELSKEETYQILSTGAKQDFLFAKYVNANGVALNPEEKTLLNEGKLYRTYFKNTTGKVMEVQCRPIENDEQLFGEIKLMQFLASNPLSNIQRESINCSLSDSIILAAGALDQGIRNGSIDGDFFKIDSSNRVKVTSVIEQCGFPKTKETIEAAWYVIQHSGQTGLMEYYHSQFNMAYQDSLLQPRRKAMMDDRILMTYGFPQIYGTQLSGSTHSADGSIDSRGRSNGFHDIRDPLKVNERRAKMGLIPIEEEEQQRKNKFNS